MAAAAGAPGAAPVLTVEQARQRVMAGLPRVQERERLSIRHALGRVLADDVVSPIDVPAHDNSAMDGYALRAADLAGSGPTQLPVAGTALAGQPFHGSLPAGHCLRIMTGAMLPPGLDSVVPQEAVSVVDGRLVVPAGSVQAGQHVRLRGEDLARGRPALPSGRRLRSADLGLLASLGQAEVVVWRPLRVAVFSTGDELRGIGQPLDEGCIYDSNRHALLGLLQGLPVEALDLGMVRDDPAALEAVLLGAAAQADVILTSGGVSSGEADHTRALLARLGQVTFCSLAMRPGRPLAFGRIAHHGREALLFGLPGNPVASMVAFLVFVRDALLTIGGATAGPPVLLKARASGPMRKRPGRTEYQRGLLGCADGEPTVRLTGSQGSGILHSMSQADALVVLHHEQGDVAPGDWVDVMPLQGLL
ncbi:molybdopterin molybdotransferase MoeA [Eleftheria terrae]|uniref:molybdopterin molybdotransferase MoeA n=1 Tax=Eleftheria terrae TaxID=1597781 RepID=UPI00263A9F47|nr:gephyrin-like molybdotransferase Glp [Eleftheria terrae]WKB53716.1 molybdopterin molybdotransferase MoeA [Eleftheria terrae]